VLLALGDVLSITRIMDLMGTIPSEDHQAAYFSVFGMVQGLGTFLAYGLGTGIYAALGPAVLFGLMVPVAALAAVMFRGAARASAPASSRRAASA
jgi:hypothetical protein